MGLIYDPKEGQQVVQILGNNLGIATNTLEHLLTGSQQLVSALGPGTTLSSQAYLAGKNLFEALIIPTINRFNDLIQSVKQDHIHLSDEVNLAGNDLLNEDKLNAQLKVKQHQLATVEEHIQSLQQMINVPALDDAISTFYQDTVGVFEGSIPLLENDIQQINTKLQKLHNFNTSTSSLFTNTLDELQSITAIAKLLGNAQVDPLSGQVQLPGGVDVDLISHVVNDAELGNDLLIASPTIRQEWIASAKKITSGTGWRSKVSIKSSKSGLKTMRQFNGEVNRFESVSSAKSAMKLTKAGDKAGRVFGAAGAVLDGGATYLDRKDKYGEESAAIDGAAHTAVGVASGFASAALGAEIGAAVGTAIPIPVVGTVVGAVGGTLLGYVIGGTANTLYDGFAHGTWNLDNFAIF